jgi:hypothetical protein
VYNLNCTPTALGVQSRREITPGGTRTKGLNTTGLVGLLTSHRIIHNRGQKERGKKQIPTGTRNISFITMHLYTSLWIYTRLYGSIHVTMHLYSSLWIYTCLYGSIHVPMDLYTSLCIYTRPYGSIQILMDLYTSLWIYTRLYASIHVPMDLYTSLWIYTRLYGSVHFSMALSPIK